MIELRSVGKIYTAGKVKVEALKDINLKVEKGEMVAVVGPSGSGKTTLLNIIGFIDVPSSGEYIFNGDSIKDLSQSFLTSLRLEHVGFVFQNHNLLPSLTIFENVEYPLLLKQSLSKFRKQRLTPALRKEKVMGILKELGIEELADRFPDDVSGGQRQRAAVARVIVKDPSLLVADEPTANLDTDSAFAVMDSFKRLNLEKGVTVIFATHDERLLRYASRVVRLVDGRIDSDEFV